MPRSLSKGSLWERGKRSEEVSRIKNQRKEKKLKKNNEKKKQKKTIGEKGDFPTQEKVMEEAIS